jgi:hypothetical protein
MTVSPEHVLLQRVLMMHASCLICIFLRNNPTSQENVMAALLVRAGSGMAGRFLLVLQLLAAVLPHARAAPITFQRVPNVNDVPPQDLGRLQRCLSSCAVNNNNLVTAFDANLTGVHHACLRGHIIARIAFKACNCHWRACFNMLQMFN